MQTAARPKSQVIPLKRYGIIYTCFVFFLVLTWGKVWRPSAMLICATCLKRKRKQHTQKLFSTMKENTICTAAYDTMEDHFKKSLPQMKDSNSFLFYNDDCSVGLVMAWRSIIGYENKSPKKKKNSYPCGGTIWCDFTFSESYKPTVRRKLKRWRKKGVRL